MSQMICRHERCKEMHKFDRIPLYECPECGLIFTDKHGLDFDPKAVYKEYYRNEMAGRFSFGVEHVVRTFRFFRAFKLFTIYPRARRILDIGSGRGFMLYYLRKYYGYSRAAGIQISKNAYEFSREKLGLEMYDKDFLELPFENGTFDIVSMWHVLEHVANPEKYIDKIRNILNDRGRLIIEVPNFNSWSRPLTGEYWLGLDLDYHVTFFTPRSLTDLLKKYNFEIRTIRTFSLEYSIFISTQSLVSMITRSRHIFFRLLQSKGFSPRLIPHGIVFILLAPLCFLINTLLYFSRWGEVLLVIAEKNANE